MTNDKYQPGDIEEYEGAPMEAFNIKPTTAASANDRLRVRNAVRSMIKDGCIDTVYFEEISSRIEALLNDKGGDDKCAALARKSVDHVKSTESTVESASSGATESPTPSASAGSEEWIRIQHQAEAWVNVATECVMLGCDHTEPGEVACEQIINWIKRIHNAALRRSRGEEKDKAVRQANRALSPQTFEQALKQTENSKKGRGEGCVCPISRHCPVHGPLFTKGGDTPCP